MPSWEERMFDDQSRHLDRFGAVLAITTVSIVLQMLIDLTAPSGQGGGPVASLVITGATGGVVLLALRASGVVRRVTRIADILVGLSMVLLVILFLLETAASTEPVVRADTSTPPLFLISYTALAPVVMVRRLLRHKTVGRSTLTGTVAAYLLIAAAFAYTFLAIESYTTDSFFGQPEPTTSFMYFSLVTVTTLGYGDLSPVSNLGRLAATTEAVIGQVFLVTFVGMIVGLLVQSRE